MITINADTQNWSLDIFKVTENTFETLALSIFQYQYQSNPVYRSYCNALQINPEQVKHINQIPFLPIQFFKSQQVVSGNLPAKAIFESSGTTGTINSKHYVADLELYEQSFLQGFEQFYGKLNKYCILGLLPSYLERGNASLVYMVQKWIVESKHPSSGFYLNEWDKLKQTIEVNEQEGTTTLLIGVSFALMDFFEHHPMQLQHTIIMETGGMKGRRAEMTKAALHQFLSEKTGLTFIHSEYGMTELLSQGYSTGSGIFRSVPWMKIKLRAADNPLEIINTNFNIQDKYRGVVNVIDLANVHSCSFIATEDQGVVYADGSFEIIGRIDNSDVRGCSQMVAS